MSTGAITERDRLNSELIASQLAEQGWTCQPQALAPDLVDALIADCRREWARRNFESAGIGQGSEHQVRRKIRSDQVYWWEPEPATSPRARFMALIDALRQELNRHLFLALHEVEMHYAVYPPGGFYKRHLDQFRGRNNRQVSLVCFLNQDWREEDGGYLRLYPGGAGETHDIAPLAGTLVLFLAARIPHEVLETGKQRLSIAGWMKNRAWPLV